MEEEAAIKLTHISKKFRLFPSPKERLKEALHPFNKKYHKEFWALRDVSFDVPKGQTVGIVGRNGSGKSTLLQILCSILKPTSGEVTVNGRVSALLELGSGFNPEFTGRQNALMKGLLMGFSEKEMKQRLPEIEAFADIGEFIDQPMKIYSSGMAVRLAFAAAINVDPDILVIDEALAVGDAKFQHKCYAKLKEFQLNNKTILFVSHDAQTINAICNEAILLSEGVVLERGKPKSVTKLYFKMLFDSQGCKSENFEKKNKNITHGLNDETLTCSKEAVYNSAESKRLREIALAKVGNNTTSEDAGSMRYGNKKAEIIDFGLLDMKFNKVDALELNEDFCFVCRYLFYDTVDDIRVGVHIEDKKGVVMYGVNSNHKKLKIPRQTRGSVLDVRFQMKMRLSPGDYFATCGITSNDDKIVYDRRFDALHFHVISQELSYKPESLVDLGATIHVSDISFT